MPYQLAPCERGFTKRFAFGSSWATHGLYLSPTKKNPLELKKINSRLFRGDIELLEKQAKERGSKFQIELRQLVHRALRAEGVTLLALDPKNPQR